MSTMLTGKDDRSNGAEVASDYPHHVDLASYPT